MRTPMKVCVVAFLVVCWLSSVAMASNQKHHGEKVKLGYNLRTNLTAHKSHDDEDEARVGMDISKNVYSDGEFYEIDFDIEGSALINVKKIRIKTPAKTAELKKANIFGFTDIAFEAGNMSFEDFQDNFPEGEYSIILFFQNKIGRKTFDVTHDFPSTPVITSPEEGATDVPLTFTIEWEPLTDVDIDGLFLDIEGDDGAEIERFFTVSETSFTVPDGLLQPNTQYEIGLATYKNLGEDIYIASFRVVNITTGSEELLQ